VTKRYTLRDPVATLVVTHLLRACVKSEIVIVGQCISFLSV